MSLTISTEKAILPSDANISKFTEKNFLEVIVKCEPIETIPPEQIKTEVADEVYKEHEIKKEMSIGPAVLQGGSVESSGSDNNKMTKPPDCGSFVPIKQEPEDVIVKSEQEGVSLVEIEVPALYEEHKVKEEMVIGPVVLQKDAPVQYIHIDTCKTSDRNSHDVTTPSAHTQKPEPDLSVSEYRNKEAKAVVSNNIRVHTQENELKCNICGEKFNYGRSLNRHMQAHVGANPHVCEICSKSFSLLCDLKAHQWTHKNIKDKHVVCEICQKQLKLISMADHYKIHTGEKPFKCDTCDKRFGSKTDLKRHQVIHSDVKPFACDMCDKRFFSNNYLQCHKAKHTGVKAFSCDICDKRFYIEDDLRNHQKIHTGVKPFQCDICDKRYFSNSALKHHQVIHSGVKPFPCDVCDMRYCSKNALKRHQMVHTGVKLFPCDFCDKRFFDRKGLKRHLWVHSND